MNQRALLLDALGTLVDLSPPAPALRRELSLRFGIRLGAGEAERALAAVGPNPTRIGYRVRARAALLKASSRRER